VLLAFVDFLWIRALATLNVRLPMLRTPAARTTRIGREDLPHGGSGRRGRGSRCPCHEQERPRCPHCSRCVASTDGHGQPGRIAAIITIAIAIDIGAVVIVVGIRLAGALGPSAHRRHDRRRGHKHVHWDRQCHYRRHHVHPPIISMMTATAIIDLRGDESAAASGREHGGAAGKKNSIFWDLVTTASQPGFPVI
jgi:hypothetical protein